MLNEDVYILKRKINKLEEKGFVIENRHSGIPKMRRKMKKMNLPEPEIIGERGSFKVIFKNSFD